MSLPGVLIALLPALAWGHEPLGNSAKPWLDMDYGPFLSASIEAPFPPKNIAAKGIAVRLKSADGSQEAAVLFDTDLLRWAAGWTGGFVDLKGVVFDGAHWAYPSIQGAQVFGTSVQPGWARDGSFADPRSVPYGPLPADWARWQGIHVHGERVVLSYRVAGVRVLEHAGLEQSTAGLVFVRTIEVRDASAKDLELVVLEAPEAAAPSVAVVDATGRARIEDRPGRRRVIRLPAGSTPLTIKVLIAAGETADLTSSAPTSLEPLTHGSPARWAEDVITRGILGGDGGPFAVDVITPPDQNPWRSWIRFGGFDFLDSTTCVLSTWNGDVWTVRGVDDGLEKLVWRRIAAGLYQPLGVKVRDGEVYTVGRDQITRLVDLNGDGETDFYECFNNDQQNTEHFHEFAMDLQTDAAGDFYYMKAARHALDSVVPHHGTLLKVARDGSATEIIANGFRAPNGLCVTPQGEIYSTDQQGHWIPANRINRLEPGSFHGNMFSYHRGARPVKYDEPLCWIHPSVDRSPSTLVHVDSKRWGPLAGSLLSLSYGMGQIFLVPRDVVVREDGARIAQGGVVKLPLEFDTGICRGRFHSRDGQLYASGLFGWAGNKTRPGGFFRIRATGKPLLVPIAFHARAGALELVFPEPLAPDEARTPGNYSVQCWSYRWTKDYGSPDVRFDGREGRDTLEVAAVELLADGRTVRLALPGLRPVQQLHVEMRLRAASGEQIKTALHATVHVLGAGPAGPAAPSTTALTPGGVVALDREASGMVLAIDGRGADGQPARDLTVSRLAAIRVPWGERPTPFIEPGRLAATWSGSIKVELNESCRFEAHGRGRVKLLINGAPALDGEVDEQSPAKSQALPLAQGRNALDLEYLAPAAGDAWVRLYWQLGSGPLEPVPPAVLVHDPRTSGLEAAQRLRQGRELVLERGCVRCHAGEHLPPHAGSNRHGPSLAGAGTRWREEWLAAWIDDPRRFLPEARMPRIAIEEDFERLQAAQDLAAFLATINDKSATPVPVAFTAGDSAQGAALWSTLGCFACHVLSGDKLRSPLDDRVPLAHVRAKWRPEALIDYLQAPSRRSPHSRMPDFQLAAMEAQALAAFLLDRPAASGLGRSEPAARRGNAENGRKLAEALRCAACHELPEVPAPAGATPYGRLTLGLDRGCLGEDPAGDGAPDFDFSETERVAVQAFLRGHAAALWQDASIELAERRIEDWRCTACHERDGSADVWFELDPNADRTLDAGEAVEPGTIHRLRPSLTWAGEKLRPEWTRDLLAGTLRYKPRARSGARMPVFRDDATAIARGLALEHGFPAASPQRPAPDARLAEIGRSLTGTTGLVCLQCHPAQGKPALAGPDTETIDLSRVAHRLTEHYYFRFLDDPVRLLPGSMMPRYTTDDGRSVITSVLDGDASRQFNALWHYFRTIESDQ